MRPVSHHPRVHGGLLAAALTIWTACGPQVAQEESPRQESRAALAASDCFDWPMAGLQGSETVPGYNVRVMQNYANRGGSSWYSNRAHSGVDLALNTGSTAGSPVYAVADGVVRCVVNANYPGWVVVIEHTLGSGAKVYTQYGHMNAPSVGSGATVTRGQQIATILDQASNSHLHFEVRDWLYWKGATSNCYGPGYAEGTYQPEQQGWTDPVDYYYQHRPAFPALAVSDISQAVRSAPNRSSATLTTIPAGTRLTVDSVIPAQDGLDDWWYRVKYDGVNWGYMAGYWDSGWGGDIYMTEPRRACTSSVNGAEVQESVSTVPATLAPGATSSVTLRVKNTGTTTWKKSSLHRLGALSSNSISWVSFSSCGGYANSSTDARVELCHDVAPGATHDFSFSVRAPSSGSSTTLSVQMVQDGVQWFGEQQSWSISLSGSTSVPAQVTGMSPDGYANMGSGSVALSWSPSSGATYYEVYMMSWNGTQWVYYNTFTTSASSLTITPTVRNTTYTYTVKAWNSVGQAPQSAWATFQYQ